MLPIFWIFQSNYTIKVCAIISKDFHWWLQSHHILSYYYLYNRSHTNFKLHQIWPTSFHQMLCSRSINVTILYVTIPQPKCNYRSIGIYILVISLIPWLPIIFLLCARKSLPRSRTFSFDQFLNAKYRREAAPILFLYELANKYISTVILGMANLNEQMH